MKTKIFTIPTNEIVDWQTFHSVFRSILGFPAFYGCNMDAWIDCMSYLDDPPSGMTTSFVAAGEFAVLRIDDAASFMRRCPEQYEALIECAAFVNNRRVTAGGEPILTLMLVG
ncbi:barstar family protein [Sinorhizobium mexicanum]|uniref:Barnase inhibitor n=1 Tax=Sinorhizobium mexicanum TaxID=375549 RepID=A0A859QUX7_9HYPH|nr:barstar family protein [Sinorhizobium mexicanum]MBP1883306.1 RNAse (barnase) inhibitor barstar [Sinorhizobium mexicanum]QLL62511.1 barnase inhibitor [Sinorhizobium mexicanum]